VVVAATDERQVGLTALLTAALALPSAAASADDGIRAEDYTLNYSRGRYAESSDRMRVNVDSAAFKANLTREIVSGASVFSNVAVNGKATQVKTGASIREQRDALTIGLAHYGNDTYAGLEVGRSVENDYLASHLNARVRRYYNDKNTILQFGAGVSRDTVWEAEYPPSPAFTERQRRVRRDASIGLTQVLDRNSVGQIILAHRYSSGFLDSQYRRVAVMNGNAPTFYPDARPNSHRQLTILARYSRFLESPRSAVHLDYRMGVDSWRAHSHTVEGKWRVELGHAWTVSQGLRYYTQKSAYFYNVVFGSVPSNRLMSSDYRLAGFGAIAPRFEVTRQLGERLTVGISYEHYLRRRSLAIPNSRGSSIDDYQSRLLLISIDGVF
jgi:Protein of unknown function (DUF3570)